MSEERRSMSAADMRLLSDAEQIVTTAEEAMAKTSTDELSAILIYIEDIIETLSSTEEGSSWPMPRTQLRPLMRMSAAWAAHMAIRNLEQKRGADVFE